MRRRQCFDGGAVVAVGAGGAVAVGAAAGAAAPPPPNQPEKKDMATPSATSEEVLGAEAARWFVDEEVVADPLHHHPPNCLRVAVVRGRGLRAMDGKGVASSLLGTGRGGSSDPYVTVGTKRFVAKTKVKAKTLDPVWMEAFELEYDAGDAWLRLRVDDSDVAGHEFMGSGLVKLSELPRNHDDDGSATAFWVTLIDGDCGHDELEYDSFRLRARDREKDLGEIKVAVKLCYDRRRDPSEDRPFFDEAPDPAAAGRWPNELRVAVCRAEGLREGDAAVFRSGSGSSDPYVRLSLEGDFCELLQRTKTAMKTTHPVFNEIFAFELAATPCRREGRAFALKLEVFDWDWIGDDDFLGQPLLHALPQEPPCDEEPNVCASRASAGPRGQDRGLLKSAAHAANKLHLAHFAESSADGSADPRAVFKLEDVDAYTKNDFMGRVGVDLSPLLDREVHRGWHKLLSTRAGDSDNVRGAVELVLKWCRDDRAPRRRRRPPEPAPAPEPEPGVGLFGAGLVAAAAARAHHHHHEPEPEARGPLRRGSGGGAPRHHHDVVSEFLQAPVEVARTPRDDDDDDSDDDDDDEDEEVLATLQEWEALEVFVEPPRAPRRRARRRGDGREEEATGRAPAVAEGRLSLRRVHLCDVCVCGGDGFAGRNAAEFCAACGSGDLDRARALLDAVAVDARDANGAGETALTRAVRLAVVAGGRRDAPRYGRALDILDLLMDRGADPYARSYEGQSAVDVLTTMADLHTGVRAYQKHERALVEAKRIEERLRDGHGARRRARKRRASAGAPTTSRTSASSSLTKQSFGTAAIYAAENDTEDTGQVELTTRAKQRLADALRMHGDPRSDPRNFMHDARRAPAAPTGDDAADFILGSSAAT
ncbi:C2 domain-containing protein [Aureococcus anophagefferens]|nr:C2 domain-containing protein [Aureococcus anophagefferens]